VLHHLVCKGSYETVQKLLEDERTLDLNVADKDGWTPCTGFAVGTTCTGRILLTYLSKRVLIRCPETEDGWTPENIAIFHNAAELVDALQVSRSTKRRSGHGTRQSSRLEQEEFLGHMGSGQEQQGYGCDECRALPIYGVVGTVKFAGASTSASSATAP